MSKLKDSYKLILRCDTCANEGFDALEDGQIKCSVCDRVYRDKDELLGYNQDNIEMIKEEIEDNVADYIKHKFDGFLK